ncbi:MAG: hypothetical protein E7536_05870 [Ruminococcaceae bacterium]|nr:hypothetical protein [Oscillospiraceae bacterium]
MKKFIAIFMVLVMMFSTFATTSVISFAEGTDAAVVSETEEPGFFAQVGKFFDDLFKAIGTFFEDIGKAFTTFFNTIFGIEETPEKEDVPEKPVSEWRKDEIIDFYKSACNKSTGVTSTQYMYLKKNTLTAGDGAGAFLSLAEGIITGVLEKNTIEFDGITGGYKDLTASDCKQAKAYKDGGYTVIEMVMYDQVDDAYGNKYSGTVGHAISVVDGVAEVAEQFPLFDVQYENADIKISYTNAILKVKINSEGVIEKGTWSYVVTPSINNLYIEKLLVNNAGAVIDYKVTVGGGF